MLFGAAENLLFNNLDDDVVSNLNPIFLSS